MFRDIKWRSVITALFYCYVVPLIPPVILSSLHDRFASPDNFWGHSSVWLAAAVGSFIWVVCFYVASPMAAAYLAAKQAQTRPLLHGVTVGIIGVISFLIMARNGGLALQMTLAPIILMCSLFGSWAWKCQASSS